MPHSRRWVDDWQLQLITAIWVLAVFDAIRQGLAIPSSELATRWPHHPTYSLLAFAVFAPPILVAANYFLPNWGGRWFDWPKRLIDRRFGEGAADRFFRRLRPLQLMTVAAFTLGITGYAASEKVGAPPGAFTVSSIFVGFGIGFLMATLLESFILRRRNAA